MTDIRKKVMYLLLAVGMLAILSGCSGSDLEDYKKALETTEAFESGEMNLRVAGDVDFNTEGLTFEEQRDLSYYENMVFNMNIRFDEKGDEDKFVAKSYYSLGGFSMDTTLYHDSEETLLQLPIMDKYMRVNFEDFISDGSSDNQDIQYQTTAKFVDKWNTILKEEDVFVGKKAYILTDNGQIKTTTYTIHISNEQFNMLKNVLVEMITEDDLLKTYMDAYSSYSGVDEDIDEEAVEEEVLAWIEAIELESFEGVAYVDFDGRLVKQDMHIELVSTSKEAGEMKSMSIDYEMSFDNLGKDQEIEQPKVSPEDIVEGDDLEEIIQSIEELF